MPTLSEQQFADVLRHLPANAPQDTIIKAAKAAEDGTPLEQLWHTVNRPLVGSSDALIPQARHEHGAGEGSLRRTAEDLGASLTSPFNVALTGASLGAGLAGKAGAMGISNGARAIEAGLQVPLVAEGVNNIVHGETPGAKLGGAIEAGLGAHGINNAATHAFDPKAVVATYAKEHGLSPVAAEAFSPANAMRTADDYAAMAHAPNEPAVKASYDSLKTQIDAQHAFLAERAGVKVEPWTGHGEPYNNSAAMRADVVQNNHLYFLPTDQGITADMRVDHPMLEDSANGVANDKFRAVHDYFGHAAEGNQFGPKGEQAAFNAHRSTLTPEAHGALASETKGQNSFVNFGPHMRDPETGALLEKSDSRFLAPGVRPFADQKAGLLPEFQRQPGSLLQGDELAKAQLASPQTPASVGGRSQSTSPSIQLSPELLQEINQAHAASGGSTTNLMSGRALTPQDARYVLSPYEDRQLILNHAPSPQDLANYVAKNEDLLSKPGHNLGTWNNKGTHYLDVSIGENDVKKAIALAREHKQLAMFDMVKGKDLALPQTLVQPAQPVVSPLTAFAARAKSGLVDDVVRTLDHLHGVGVPGAQDEALKLRRANPGRSISPLAKAILREKE